MKWGFEQKAKLTIGIFFILWLAAMILSGCMTAQKATDYLKDRGKLAEVCATEYPVKDTLIYLPGDTVHTIDILPADTIICDTIIYDNYVIGPGIAYLENEAKPIVQKVKKPCPPSYTITKTVRDTIRVVRENTARVELLTSRLTSIQTMLQKETDRANYWKSKAKHRMGLVNWLIAILLALLIYTFRKPIFKAAYKLIRPF